MEAEKSASWRSRKAGSKFKFKRLRTRGADGINLSPKAGRQETEKVEFLSFLPFCSA